ncbi:Ankyrin repeat protein 3 [Giardia muris]|uniref:Ankyrin repeat protein 3 n=1 Tax=Giardia muris TaxID=5742 RepID=A0A4Z1T2U1_GIAMU|nr:Ankyrin repeat protein 3 [Giardia muris]|eukprot:TNJ27377.1 Ankyrin repeat protein 3 [Giardia muris]
MSVTALMEAAWNGDLEDVKRNLSQAGKQDEYGGTALMWAARWGHANCIPLLEKEIGMQDNWGGTALMWAASDGYTDCVRLLLSEAGKQTTKEWYDFSPGTTALMMAAYYNRPEVVQLLLPYEQGMKDSKGHTAQWHANNSSWRGDYTQVRELLENEGAERIPPPKEQPPLMVSAITGDIEGVRKHLDRIGYQDPTGTTALMMAASYGHSDCIPFLEKEIGMQDEDGLTALMWAALNGKTDCARLLLSEAGKQSTEERKFNFNGIAFPSGATALMIAAHYNYPKIVKLLLPYEQGLKDSKGHNAQWHANNSSWRGDFTRVHQLLENEGTERIPPPHNPGEVLGLRNRINELTTEIESLKKDLSSSKNTLEETKKELSQLNQEVSSLKQQLDNAIEESKRHAEVNEDLRKASDQNRALINALTTEKAALQEQLIKTTEDLKRALADQKAQNLVLEKEVAQLRTESHDMKDLQRRLEEVEEEKRILLQNLAAVGGRLTNHPQGLGTPTG